MKWSGLVGMTGDQVGFLQRPFDQLLFGALWTFRCNWVPAMAESHVVQIHLLHYQPTLKKTNPKLASKLSVTENIGSEAMSVRSECSELLLKPEWHEAALGEFGGSLHSR